MPAPGDPREARSPAEQQRASRRENDLSKLNDAVLEPFGGLSALGNPEDRLSPTPTRARRKQRIDTKFTPETQPGATQQGCQGAAGSTRISTFQLSKPSWSCLVCIHRPTAGAPRLKVAATTRPSCRLFSTPMQSAACEALLRTAQWLPPPEKTRYRETGMITSPMQRRRNPTHRDLCHNRQRKWSCGVVQGHPRVHGGACVGRSGRSLVVMRW